MKEALDWWETLTEEKKLWFVETKHWSRIDKLNDDMILNIYLNEYFI